ncbi:predicted protein [Lichtheimia corymbifera JMRC:FSU:9682]|uniref:Uncharacterized protein n=1 Tax=Lichtheimia corymbifera JMRC:FSU:9682 TaxID=1263082 RepID=A0A068RPR9_9FUNG|nr:predicted protein [Lichtheimia corymbifera JMRC:FSU:9682]
MSSDSEESLSDLVDNLAKPTKSEPASYRHSYDQLGDETDDHDDDSDLESTARPAPRKRTTHESEEETEQRQQPRKKARSSSPKRQPFREPYYFPESHQTFAREIQHRIQGLVMRGDYEDAWKLLCSIVETDKIPIISFFELALCLIRKLKLEDPALFLHRAFISSRGKKAVVIFRALIREYIDQKQFKRARDEIDLMQHKYYIEDAEIQRLSAIVNYQIWLMNQDDRDNITKASIALTTAYRSSPEHTSIVAIYLKFLNTMDPKQAQVVAKEVLEEASKENSIRRMRIALLYYQPPLDQGEHWLEIMLPLHRIDPATDPDVFAKPYLKVLRHIYQNHPEKKQLKTASFYNVMSMLLDRIEAGCVDEWTIDKLEKYCERMKQEDDALKAMMTTRNALRTVNRVLVNKKDPQHRGIRKMIHKIIKS